jgi:hypothetical protein
MIDSKKLLSDLQKFVLRLEDDLQARCDANPSINQPLQAAYDEARRKGRTASTYASWRKEELTQVAVAWVLATVFIRFLEDNELIEVSVLSGPNKRLQRARDEQEIFFRKNPTLTEREYLEKVFAEVGKLPAMKEFFDRKHNPLWEVSPSGDAAKDLVDFWRKTDPESGELIHDFTDERWDTRFLGDLYQDLSEFARKRYALLQTPVFIEQFILDRTLTPAIETFGYEKVRMIDPTCGSGHFLLGGFSRLFRLWQENRPGENPRVLTQKALDQVYGVDLNPNVVAIAHFRLLLVALGACGVKRIKDAPDFRINVAAGDSLLHGRRFRDFEGTASDRTFDTEEIFRDELKHHYEAEDTEALHRILGQQYHAVVGNPPYIAVKDSAASKLYRARYLSCHRKYSLSVPFMERFFDLAVKGDGTPHSPAGFVGQITANSFMKREFGKKLIEEFLPRWDLTHVLDTAGAYIPGHGTPTAILFGKNQPPVSETIRTVLGIRGEPATPNDPTQGLVWQAIVTQIDRPGSVSEWVSAADSLRAGFHGHPWSIGGGGAAELKESLDEGGSEKLAHFVEVRRGKPVIGFGAVLGEDEAYAFPTHCWAIKRLVQTDKRSLTIGDEVRDWQIESSQDVVFPYTPSIELTFSDDQLRLLWPMRTTLASRPDFSGKTYAQAGRPWWEYHQIPIDRNRTERLLVFAFVATHNHFTLNSEPRLFNRSSPIIKLRAGSSFSDHLKLLGSLNSSSACFWMKQIFFPKGGDQVGSEGARIRKTLWDERYEHDGSKLADFPVPARLPEQLPTALVKYSSAIKELSPAATLTAWGGAESGDLREWLTKARDLSSSHRRKLIAWQEELDWQAYEAYGLIESADKVSLPEGEAVDMVYDFGLELGERSFEIVLARRIVAGEAQSTWFERHGSTPITKLPSHWPPTYRELIERRIQRIESDPNIRLIEQPEYKRRWNTEPWDEQFKRTAREWLLARLEGYFYEGKRVCELKDGFNPTSAGFAPAARPAFTTTNQLASAAQTDLAFLAVAEELMGGPGFSVPALVRDLVESASVPFLPVQRYKPSGLVKRKDWEQVWDLQRKEDAIDAVEKIDEKGVPDTVLIARKAKAAARKETEVGDIPVPPKYVSGDFKKSTWWALRGKLDVPKERWISYPGAQPDGDPSPLIAWAGWDHLQQAKALAEYYLDAKTNQGWPSDKLKLLLAGLLELLPWLKQWHNQLDPDLGMGLGDYFAGFLEEQCRALDLTLEELNDLRFTNIVPCAEDTEITPP